MNLFLCTSGSVTKIAGTFNESGYADGVESSAKFSSPHGLVCDCSGNIYVADALSAKIRKISSSAGTVSTVITLASVNTPFGLALSASGTLYISDYEASLIRMGVASGEERKYITRMLCILC